MTDSTDSKDSKGGERKRGRALNSNGIWVYLYDAEKETLKNLAAAQNRTMAQQARHIIEAALHTSV